MANKRPDRPSNKTLPGGGFGGRAARLALFEQIYLSNGQNSTAAAIEVGYSPRSAHATGCQLVRELRESGRLAEIAEKAAQAAELSTQRTLRELRDIAYNDPRRFFRRDGTLKPVGEWDDAMAACVQSVEVTELSTGSGKNRKVVGHTGKIKFWSKIEALDKAMRHAGLFEKDNRQKAENLAIQINLIGAGGPVPVDGSVVTVRANLIDGKNGSQP